MLIKQTWYCDRVFLSFPHIWISVVLPLPCLYIDITTYAKTVQSGSLLTHYVFDKFPGGDCRHSVWVGCKTELQLFPWWMATAYPCRQYGMTWHWCESFHVSHCDIWSHEKTCNHRQHSCLMVSVFRHRGVTYLTTAVSIYGISVM